MKHERLVYPTRAGLWLLPVAVLSVGLTLRAQDEQSGRAGGANRNGQAAQAEKTEKADSPAAAEGTNAPRAADQESNTKPAPKPTADEGKKASAPAQGGANPPQQPQANPLTELLKNILRPGGGGAAPRGMNGFPQFPGGRNYLHSDVVDPRAARDRDQSNLLDKAKSYADSARWKPAMDLLQQVLDQPGDSLIRMPDGQWASVRGEANRLIGEFPQAVLDAYRLEFGGLASRLLDEARRTGDLNLYGQVATKYFHTEAGHEAANHLGTVHFDRREFAMAARWFERLREARAAFTDDPAWQVKALYAMRLAGRFPNETELADKWANALAAGLVRIGGVPADPKRWMEDAPPLGPQRQSVLNDWPLLFGNPQRTGAAFGGEPLLLRRWSHSTTYSDPIREQIDFIVDDLVDQERAAIPAFIPLAVDGKIVFRTLRGVCVVDAQSGQLLWETEEAQSAERLLTADVTPQRGSRGRWRPGRATDLLAQFSRTSAEHHPLTGLLFRNGPNGILSSDRRQLFVLEDQAILSEQQVEYGWRGIDPNQNDRYGRDWSSNRLVSYDLATGRPLWEIGGPEMHEAFDPPLAGTYFFGVPVPDGDELYLVGERDNEVRLFGLDRQTGSPRWSQLIAFSETKIERDMPRRFWPSQVAVGGGVLVCPTTVGWLVAVSQIDHSVLWAYPYAPASDESLANQRRFESSFPLNTWWCPSAPMITGNSVVYTPSEEELIVCLDLMDGTRRWQLPKGEWLYVAGVQDDRVILVGKRAVAAVSIADGRVDRRVPIPKESGPPSGRGVLVNGRLLLPLRSGELWLIDPANGEVVSRSYQRPPARPLGNLVPYQGMLLSLDASELTSFEQRQAVEDAIRQRKTQNPIDPWALIREADMLRLEHDYGTALARLREVRTGELPDDLRQDYHEALVESLVAVIRADAQPHQNELDFLGDVAQTDGERTTYLQLLAEKNSAQGDYAAAFDICEKLADEDGSQMVRQTNNPDVTLRLDAWLAGRLSRLFDEAPGDVRQALDARIHAAASDVLNGTPSDREQFVRLFGFHPASYPVQLALAEACITVGDGYKAEDVLLHLWRAGDPQTSAQAMLRLARLFLDLKLPEDAAACYRLLESERADVSLPDGRIVARIIENVQQTAGLDIHARPKSVNWGNADMRLTRSGTNYEFPIADELDISNMQAPFFRRFQFHVVHQLQRLTVTEPETGNLYWTVPLRSSVRALQPHRVPACAAGHQLVVLHQDVVHSLSLLDRKVAWTFPLDARGSAAHYRQPGSPSYQPMTPGRQFASANSLSGRLNRYGMLADANTDFVCVYGRRQFTVLDAASGQVRWTRVNISPRTDVFGGEGIVYVWPRDRSARAAAYSSIDGKPLDVENLEGLFEKTVYAIGKNLVMMETRNGKNSASHEQATIAAVLYDPIARKRIWEVEFPEATNFSLSEAGWIIALEPLGSLKALDLRNGTTKTLGRIKPGERLPKSQLYAVVDADHVFLIVDFAMNFALHYDNLPSLWVNGALYAFDLNDARQMWKATVSEQNLVLAELARSPVLVFSARRYTRNSRHYTLNLLVLDKETGRTLLKYDAPTSYATFQSVSVNLARKYVELCTYNERIRLEVVDEETASAQ